MDRSHWHERREKERERGREGRVRGRERVNGALFTLGIRA